MPTEQEGLAGPTEAPHLHARDGEYILYSDSELQARADHLHHDHSLRPLHKGGAHVPAEAQGAQRQVLTTERLDTHGVAQHHDRLRYNGGNSTEQREFASYKTDDGTSCKVH